jgi:hypothetical protein
VGASEGDTESVGEGIGTTVGIEDGTMVGTEVACAIDPKHAAMSTRPAVRIIFAATQSVPKSSVRLYYTREGTNVHGKKAEIA